MKQLPRRNTHESIEQAGERRTMGKQRRYLRLVSAKPARRRSTLLDLVRSIQDTGRGDEEVVATISELIESGEVVLCGTFAGAALEPSVDGAAGSATTDKVTPTSGLASVRFAR